MTPPEAREFCKGPASKAAERIIEESGVYRLNENFNDALAEADGDAEYRKVLRLYEALEAQCPAKLKKLLLELLDAHVAAMSRRTDTAYLVGLATGRRLP